MHLLNLILFRLANLSTVSIPERHHSEIVTVVFIVLFPIPALVQVLVIKLFLYQYSMCKIHQTIQFFIWSNTVVLRVTFEQSVHGIIVIIIIII